MTFMGAAVKTEVLLVNKYYYEEIMLKQTQ